MLTTADQEIRKGRITGTRIGAIVGLSKYKTAIDVWQEILGVAPKEDLEASEDIQRGRHLEPALLSWYAHKTGYKVLPQVATVHPEDRRFAATPDGVAITQDGEEINLECKSPRRGEEWGDSETDDIPDVHVCQVALQMDCTRRQKTHLIALVWGQLRIYTIRRNIDFEKVLIQKGADFWDRYIEPGIPPPPDASAAYTKYLSHHFSQVGNKVLIADAETALAGARYLELKAQIEELEKEKGLIKNQFCQQIGDNRGIKGDGWRALWSLHRGREKKDWEAYARSLGGDDQGIAKYTGRGAGYRNFDLRRVK